MKKSITSQKYILSLMYILCGVMVFLLTLSVNTFSVSAEGSNSLPYQVQSFDSWVNADGYSISDLQQFYNNRWGSAYPLDFSLSGTFAYEYVDSGYNWTVVYCPNGSVPTRANVPYYYFDQWSTIYNSFDVTNDSVLFHGINYGVVTFSTYRNKYNDPQFSGIGNYSIYLFGSYNKPIVASSDFFDNTSSSSGENVVFGLPSTTPNTSGHATPPINNSGHFIPNPHPNKPNPTPYTPPTPQFPSIDTSTLESLVESLIDVVEYGFSYTGTVVSGWFNNLISNVSDYLDYIGDLLVSGFNNVVGSIQDFATDFYNNMVSLIEPVFEFFSGVSNFFNTLVQLGMVNGSFEIGEFLHNLIVPSTSDVLDLLMDNDSVGSHHLYLAIYHKVSDIIDIFDNLQPTKVFTVPSTTWHGYTIGGFTVDFSWYDDYKSYMDVILSGFLVIGYLYWLYLQLNSLFRGTGSVVYDSLYETPTKGGDSH